MKHILVRFLAVVLAVCLVGCSAPVSSSAPQSASSPASQSVSSSAASVQQGVIEAKTDAMTAEITISLDMLEELGTTAEEYMENARQGDGFIDITQSEDGTVTLTLEKKVYDQMLLEMRDSINEFFPMENYPSVKAITCNSDVTAVKLTVDQEAYQEGTDSFAMLGVYMCIGYYHIFSGAPDTKTTITLVDEATGNVFETILWPEDLEKASKAE